jgi:hypothetical protein
MEIGKVLACMPAVLLVLFVTCGRYKDVYFLLHFQNLIVCATSNLFSGTIPLLLEGNYGLWLKLIGTPF